MRILLLCLLTACSFHSPSSGDDDTIPDAAGEAAIDAAPDAPRPIELTQATSMTVAAGNAIFCHGAQLTRDNAWYRAFKLADYGIGSVFNAESVHFAAEQARGAVVTATIYAYEGTTGGTSIDTGQLTLLAANAASVPDSDSPQAGLTIAIPHQVNALAVVVEISATDTQNSAGIPITYFHLGANTAGQSGPSYYQSSACGIAMPSAQGGADFVLSVAGTY